MQMYNLFLEFILKGSKLRKIILFSFIFYLLGLVPLKAFYPLPNHKPQEVIDYPNRAQKINNRRMYGGELGLGVMNYLYVEPNLMQIHSILPTAHISGYLDLGNISLVLGGMVGYSSNGSYDGALINLETHVRVPVALDSIDLLTDMYFKVGYSKRISFILVNSYAGFGLYGLDNKLGGAHSYERNQTYNYTLANIGLGYTLNKYLLKLDFTYKYTLGAENITKLTDIGFVNDAIFTKQKGYGIESSLEFGKEIDDFTYSLRLAYRYWNIGDSEVRKSYLLGKTYTVIEPANYTHSISLEAVVGF